MKLNHSIIIAILLIISPAISLAERDASAQYNLGVSYAYGLGVPEDSKEAVTWYRLAVEQGHAKAQYNLDWMYFNGEGVPEERHVLTDPHYPRINF